MNIEHSEIANEEEATRPVFEDVEQRTHMSVADLDDHELTVIAEEGNDRIELDLNDDASELTVEINGGEVGTFAANAIYVININAGNGNNRITLDPRIGATTGLVTGSGRDTIYGGSGNDYISSGGGHDVIDARAGNDTITSGSGNDKVNAGSGNDYVNAGSGNDSVSADGGVDKLMGRKGNDKFYADADDNVQGDGGKDQVTTSRTPMSRDDGYEAPRVTAVSIVDADTGKVVKGYERLTADTVLDGDSLPTRYTVVALAENAAQSVWFDLSGEKAMFRRDSDGTFSMTNDAGTNRFTAWQPTAGSVYTLKVAANTADDLRGITGDVFQIRLSLKKEASGAGVPTAPTTPTKPTVPTAPTTPAVDPAAPKIKLNVLTKTVIAGQGFHAEATGTTLSGGHQAEDARFEWDFGDPAGKFNKMPGFNAAHVYEKAGKYTATLTVTAPGGKVSKASFTVEVKATAYKTIYVAANGNDAREGATQDQAVKTLARAAQLAGDDTKILMRRGDTFGVVSGATIENDNVVIDTYGVGASPVIRYEGARKLTTLITVTAAAQNVMINGLTFTSIYDDDANQTGMCHAINDGGTNVTIRNNTFLHVGYGVNTNANPDQVYLVGNTAPLADGLRGYLIWTQGSNLVIVGNTVENSTREHAIRASNFRNMNVSFNDLSNLDRRYLAKGADAGDFAKCTVNIQKGMFAYVANNEMYDGNVAIGPLGGGDGVNIKEHRLSHAVIDGNSINNTQIIVQHGIANATVRDNVINFDDDTQIIVRGWNTEYGRGVVDLVVDHNLGINDGTKGRFVELASHAEGMILTNNVFVAPKLTPGGYGSSALVIYEGNASSFKTVNGNIWPTGKLGAAKLNGGLMWFGSGYISASTWNNLPPVGTDRSEDVSATSGLKLTPSMLKAA